MSFEEDFNVGVRRSGFDKNKIIIIISAIVGVNILAGAVLAWFFYYKSPTETEDLSGTTKYSEKNSSIVEEAETRDLTEGYFYSDERLDNEEFKETQIKQDKEESEIRHRNAKRMSDIKRLQYMMIMYLDKFGVYPDSYFSLSDLDDPVYNAILGIPKDPLDDSEYFYEKISDDQYHLGANLEIQKYGFEKQVLSGKFKGVNVVDLDDDDDIVTLNINGLDKNGCNGELDRICFDVTQ